MRRGSRWSSPRLAGVRSAAGALTVGRHSTAYRMAGTPPCSAPGESCLRRGSPTFRGFTANAAAYLDIASDHDYGVGLGYRGHGLEAGLRYHDMGGGRTWAPTRGLGDPIRGHASYGRDGWSVGGSYERVEADGGDGQTFLFAAATRTGRFFAPPPARRDIRTGTQPSFPFTRTQ